MSKVYLIGPANSQDAQTIALFQQAQTELERKGHDVINLAWENSQEGDQKKKTAYRLKMLLSCDTAIVLDKWYYDPFACLEIVTANAAGMKIIPANGVRINDRVTFSNPFSIL